MFNSTKNKIQEAQSSIEQHSNNIKSGLSNAKIYQSIAKNYSTLYDKSQDKEHLDLFWKYHGLERSVIFNTIKEYISRSKLMIEQCKTLVIFINNSLLIAPNLSEDLETDKSSLYSIIAKNHAELYGFTRIFELDKSNLSLLEDLKNEKSSLYYVMGKHYSEIYDLAKSESYLLESLTNYSLAVKNAPTNIVFLAGRAKVLHQLGRYEDVNKDIEMIKELFDSSQTNTDQEIAAYNIAEELSQNLVLSGEASDSDDTN